MGAKETTALAQRLTRPQRVTISAEFFPVAELNAAGATCYSPCYNDGIAETISIVRLDRVVVFIRYGHCCRRMSRIRTIESTDGSTGKYRIRIRDGREIVLSPTQV